ncbi:Ferric/cupric reductase transmembrane component B [Colletotrichum orbiculare MAFF 240422]|uniref:Ferric/cupric reductase transmembrane component B n=1 Tax=Colletotrichum orbiculare (strain 104-T / ATCC 96160 / CBS 514.97 / LARS 414 / MAFF 240422) TaxID=1213857 RepID=N4V2Q2_COLOR|nr:Ferric/cupric reductase transmembrane component B [Colletotrichum orbiculare MAFF 240422]
MHYTVGFVIAALLRHAQSQSGNGIIGFGISLYEDLCCQACHDSLAPLYLNCTSFDMPGMSGTMQMGAMMGMTSPECYVSSTPWLQSMAYCIQQNCNLDGYPEKKQAECFQKQAVFGAKSPTFQQSLPATPPTDELAADAMWLNKTSRVNRDKYYSTHGSEGEFARSEYLHSKLAITLYLLVIGLFVLCGFVSQIGVAFPKVQKQIFATALLPKLRQYVFLPAFIGSRRLEPLPGQVGYMPRRTLSIFIVIYVILNVVFSAVGFDTFQPNTMFKSKGFELCEYVANRTGILSLVNAGMAILFAGRNNVLLAWTGWSLTTFITLHRWFARISVIQAVVHSIVYTLAYWQPGYGGASEYLAKTGEPFYQWGIVATIFFCLATGVAILPIRLNFYELFLALHIVFIVVALVGCWYHIVPHFGYEFGYQTWLYICFAFWAFDRLARLTRIAYFNRPLGSKAVLEAVPDTHVMQLTVHPHVAWEFGPGQHSALNFRGVGWFWESHPFSVAGWRGGIDTSLVDTAAIQEEISKDPGAMTSTKEVPQVTPASVTFLIRAGGGITAKLQRRLALSTAPRITLPVYTEGPYGGHRARHQSLYIAETVLCIAGGIGITGVLGYIQEYTRASLPGSDTLGASHGIFKNTKRFILAWSAREMALIDHVRQTFLAQAPGVDCSFWCTGASIPMVALEETGRPDTTTTITKGVILGRMETEAILRHYLEEGTQTTVLVCGPSGMADEVTQHVVNSVRDGYSVDLIEEPFAW